MTTVNTHTSIAPKVIDRRKHREVVELGEDIVSALDSHNPDWQDIAPFHSIASCNGDHDAYDY